MITYMGINANLEFLTYSFELRSMQLKSGTYPQGNKKYIVHRPTRKAKPTTIEFKRVSRERALGQWADQTQKCTIIPTLNSKGYLDDLTDYLNNTKYKETILINIGIGRGKTYSIYEHVRHLYCNTDEIVILASPFKSLVNKDYDSLVNLGIPKTDIQNYLDIQELSDHYKSLSKSSSQTEIGKNHIKKKRIHIISFNSLILNPGDVSYFPAKSTRQYVKGIIDHLKSKEKKVTLIMDEIHESVHNFSPKNVFNLYRFKPYIKKVVIASATFTESSIEASIRISHLTDYYTQIIELPREKFPKGDLCDLNLCFTNQDYNRSNTKPLDIIQWIITQTKAKRFHILSYSKNLVDILVKDNFYKNFKPNIEPTPKSLLRL